MTEDKRVFFIAKLWGRRPGMEGDKQRVLRREKSALRFLIFVVSSLSSPAEVSSSPLSLLVDVADRE